MKIGLNRNQKHTVKKIIINMKKNSTIIGIVLWFIFITLFSVFITSCNGKNHTIEDGDKIVKCVIDSQYSKQPESTLQIDPTYVYITDCGNRITTNRNDVYKIGDTITYVYKKQKK